LLTLLERINQIKGVKGSSIVSHDGLEIVSHFRTQVPSDFISALIVSIQQVADRIVDKLEAGPLVQTMIEATEGKFFVQAVELGYLVVLADSQANTGLIRVEIAQVSPQIK
jgi:predicted regulator of Ras-like GTPase activity (Roadblock/LC7/MglB family)